MATHSHDELRRVFELAWAAPADERESLLARECGGDLGLKQRVEAMIAAAEDDGFLSEPTAAAPASTSSATTIGSPASTRVSHAVASVLGEGPGSQIGPYKILELIGEGGFGSVFMAEQQTPLVRKVALKIIKLGMDTRQVIARFEAERQALAMMDHPNIAKVFDAGATAAGRPFFVMELCKGDPISKYCDRHQLNIHERLELFAQVCLAVQHAHTKGVIHRDIKPSNILVSTQDGKPRAKVIDFGIAKATDSKLTEKTLFTEHRQLIGTPEYMSPEQAEGSLDIDTRTDVYSLGVLLYELLTGTTPIDSRDLRSAAFGEMQRMIREVDPPSPSTRLSQASDTVASIAATRGTEPGKLGTLLRGDLDWIVMKALEKDRTLRYETANSFAIDIQRYLGGEAVLAAPPSRAYRLRKFVRRHKAAVTLASAVTVSLLIGVFAFAWQARVARQQRDIAIAAQKAEAAQRQIADEQRTRALEAEAETRKRAEELTAVADFQGSMLQQVEPAKAGLQLTTDVLGQFERAIEKAGVPTTQRAEVVQGFRDDWDRINSTDAALTLIDEAILKPAVAAIDKQFGDQPNIRARLQHVLATRYLDLGLNEPALELERRAFATRRQTLGDDNVDTLQSMCALGTLLSVLGKHEESEPLVFIALEKRRRLLGPDHPDTIESIAAVGNFWGRRNEWDKAEPYCAEAAQSRRRVLGEDHPETLDSIRTYGLALKSVGKLREAEKYMREAADRTRSLFGSDDPRTALAMGHVGTLLFAQSKYPEAEAVFREATEMHRRAFGGNHRLTLISVQNLAQAYLKTGRRDESEKLQREVLAIQQKTIGEDHQDTLMTKSNLAVLLVDQGKPDEAEVMCRDVLERRLRLFGPDNVGTLVSNNIMGYVLRRQGKPAESEQFLRAALDTARRTLPAEHPERLTYTLNMGSLVRELGRPDEAKVYFREVIVSGTPTLGAEHAIVMSAIDNLSKTLAIDNSHADQVKLLGENESAFRNYFGPKNQTYMATLLMRLGKAKLGLRRFAAAEANLIEASGILEKELKAAERAKECATALADLYAAWNTAEPSDEREAKAAEWAKKAKSIKPAPKTPG